MAALSATNSINFAMSAPGFGLKTTWEIIGAIFEPL
jgi:hypothetical protein